MDRLRAATWNVRGLGDSNGRQKRRRLKTWLHEWKVNCVLLQETKLNEDKLKEFETWWDGPQVWAPAQGTQGEVGILLHRDLQAQIIDAEADLWGRWAWLKVGMAGEDWVIMTVYALTAVSERARFFERLMSHVPVTDNLLLAGDWNISLDEALRPNSPSADRRDVRALLGFCGELSLSDPFPMLNPNDPGYSWFSNLHKERQVSTRRHLDHYLLSAPVVERVVMVKQICHPLSDHKPVVADMRLRLRIERGKGFFRLNSQVLAEPGIKDWVKRHMESWKDVRQYFESIALWMDGGLAIISGVLDACSRILARARNKEAAECLWGIEEAEKKMERHPISEMVWATERKRKLAEWDNLQEEKQRRWVKIMKEKGVGTNDKMSKTTFQKLQPRRAQQQMIELRRPFDESAPTACSAAGMLKYASLYYADVLTTRRQNEDVNTDLSLQSDMWTDTTVQLCTATQLDLDRPITLGELSQTVKVMARGKSPGVDDLTVEFYSANWKVLGPLLVELYNEVLVGGKLGKRMTHGVITVLFKKGNKSDVSFWRPISLLNVAYKILVKSLARRLSRHLPGLVEQDQGAFVQRRSIFNNIVTTIETLEIVQTEELDMAVLSLDLDKAYDKVGWTFVLTTLKPMGFGPGFSSWIKAMYRLQSRLLLTDQGYVYFL
ncbi:hypothetical protein CBR_g23448 [Chara braunii]|uniref:Uncharacterized protein n=1 Tax=Chara braunii TaxID=69332 RepID=A0A388L4F1_CHABU|nr:hypothetical protein CBR_g23448 [Chara braunii]|eukprot:GBG77122.1 hypothetical protein CBR_g23448 [Chara braunii]